jgi:hypothetical protein
MDSLVCLLQGRLGGGGGGVGVGCEDLGTQNTSCCPGTPSLLWRATLSQGMDEKYLRKQLLEFLKCADQTVMVFLRENMY